MIDRYEVMDDYNVEITPSKLFVDCQRPVVGVGSIVTIMTNFLASTNRAAPSSLVIFKF